MPKYQLHLSKPVRAVGRLESLRGEPLAAGLVELPPRVEAKRDEEPAVPPPPSEELLQLQQQFRELEQQVATKVDQIGQKLDALTSLQQVQQSELRQLALRLAMLVTRTIMKQLTQETEQRLEHLVNEGLSQMPGAEAVTVRLHPSQCDRLAYHFDELSIRRKLRFLPDSALPPGEVTLEHPLFSLTSDLGEQLNQMEQALREELLP